MSLRTVLIALALLAAALSLGLGLGVLGGAPAAKPQVGHAERAETGASEPAGREPRRAPASVSRDLTRYAEEPRPQIPEARPEPLGPIVMLAPTAAPPAERLIGFVRRKDGLRAALALPGPGTIVLRAGEQHGGYTLVALDEQDGVVLRLPDGRERSLPLPPD